ncbi:hypothetical protein G7Y89_g8432 [Cudoniella acicularis]|uniref:NmrA-like domain-containing protein n=1 Tax=Cudoniella acicularis TaxID=354080 RepID=A0A8H4RHH2_9HELO|nr:hypothetical protein G7Y89_g8432 [Cudoniella acicularis]
MATKPLLITGATGKQGSAVISALFSPAFSNHSFQVLAVTRNPTSPSSQSLLSKYPSIKLVSGDLDDVASIFKNALEVTKGEPIWGVYSVQVSMGKGVTFESEVTQGKNLIDESAKRGVKHFVYSSVERGGNEKSWENGTPIPHFQTKQIIEKHLRTVTSKQEKGKEMGWTILRPVAFMENLVPGFPTSVFLTALKNTLPPSKTLQWVSVVDIGYFAALSFSSPSQYNKKAIGLAGDELTFEELNECFEDVTGKEAPTTYWFFGTALMWAVREMGVMVRWFGGGGV